MIDRLKAKGCDAVVLHRYSACHLRRKFIATNLGLDTIARTPRFGKSSILATARTFDRSQNATGFRGNDMFQSQLLMARIHSAVASGYGAVFIPKTSPKSATRNVA